VTLKSKKKKEDAPVVRRSPEHRIRTPMLPTETDIASRAYQLFVERGGEHGRDWEDWLLAERELGPVR
jgi:hypothetical protein